MLEVWQKRVISALRTTSWIIQRLENQGSRKSPSGARVASSRAEIEDSVYFVSVVEDFGSVASVPEDSVSDASGIEDSGLSW
jgi:hypothetical protein